MRRIAVIVTALSAPLALVPRAAGAQVDSVRQTLPAEVRRDVVDRWNRPVAMRASDRAEIAAGNEVQGDVAVQHGPLFIAGHVTGSVLAVNSDVQLSPTARIDGDLIVVGGEVDGLETARVGGVTRVYHEPLAYRSEGDRIVLIEDESAPGESFWHRLERRRAASSFDLRIVQAGPYNRVEGLPINLGPSVFRHTAWGGIRVDAAAVLRTADFRSSTSGIGDNLRAEVQFGHERGIGIGAQAFDDVAPVEDWQLSNLEVALASFLVRRDYRDYYRQHGGRAFVRLFGARNLNLTASYGDERWSTVAARDVFTLFNGDEGWRPNPATDDGVFHVLAATFAFDTRNDPFDPWAGWYVDADIEHARGTIAAAASALSDYVAGDVSEYSRGFLDVRRYNRLSPDQQLNLRLVLGGWLGGDPLPLERRLSVDGPGALPGFDFRSPRAGTDVGTCNGVLAVAGQPAACDRIALAQVELRGDLRLDVMSWLPDWPLHNHGPHGDAYWVLFADGGRGWDVGTPDGSVTYASGAFPPLASFRTDLGLGVDFGGFGVYAAKSVSTPSEPLNFFVRLRHRF